MKVAGAATCARGHLHRCREPLIFSHGFMPAGKDPLATFLTQVGRSPVVKRTSNAGVFVLDRDFIVTARRRGSGTAVDRDDSHAGTRTAARGGTAIARCVISPVPVLFPMTDWHRIDVGRTASGCARRADLDRGARREFWKTSAKLSLAPVQVTLTTCTKSERRLGPVTDEELVDTTQRWPAVG